MIYRFEDFELDEECCELRQAGRSVQIRPKVLDLIAFLVRARHRAVSKSELLGAVWAGHVVSEASVAEAVSAARRALGNASHAIKTRPRRGYQFVAPVTELAARDTSAPLVEPFVGRDTLMDELREDFAEARAGRGRVHVVSGEPGIGKTYAVRHFGQHAASAGAQVCIGTCMGRPGTPALWPWVQILRVALRLGESGNAVFELSPALAPLFPEICEKRVQPLSDDPEEARFRLFDAVSRTLNELAAQRALVLILDDLQDADRATLDLLLLLTRQLGEARLLIVTTHREVDASNNHPLARFLGELVRVPGTRRTVLQGLAVEDVGSLVVQLAKRKGASIATGRCRRLASVIHDKTAGNPLFVREVAVKILDEESDGRSRDWDVLPLPASVREAVSDRLGRLQRSCRETLAAAAVVSTDFEAGFLAACLGCSPSSALEALGEGLAAGLVRRAPGPPETWSLGHELVREAIYEGLPAAERARLHAAVARVLEERLDAAPDGIFAALAHHLERAGSPEDAEKNIDFALQAAAQCERRFAFERAAAHYRTALSVLERSPHPGSHRRHTFLTAEGRCEQNAGNQQAARSAFELAAEAARRDGNATAFTEAALGYADSQIVAPPLSERKEGLLREALEVLDAKAGRLRARVLVELSTRTFASECAPRLRLIEESESLARRGGDHETLIRCLIQKMTLNFAPGQLPSVDETVDVADRVGGAHIRRRARTTRLLVLLAHGRLDRCRHLLGELEEFVLRHGCAVDRCWALVLGAALARSEGRWKEAEAGLAQARMLNGEFDDQHAYAVLCFQLFWMLRERGQLAALAPQADAIVGRYQFRDRQLRAMRLLVDVEVGKLARARSAFEQLFSPDLADLDRNEEWLVLVAQSIEFAALLGDRVRAEAAHDLLLPHAGSLVAYTPLGYCAGPVSHYLGVAASLLGRLDEAETHFEASLRTSEQAGLWPFVARGCLEQARMRLQRGAVGDRKRARQLIDLASRQAVALGLGVLPDILRAREAAGLGPALP